MEIRMNGKNNKMVDTAEIYILKLVLKLKSYNLSRFSY